jgi:pimeloyl-ACP methyl ester carboxylesterase
VGGELTFPDTLGRYPLVILAGDRGQADRVARGKHGHAPYLVLASMFAQRNIATVRIDDRGTGQTTGAANDQSVDDEASDVSAVLDALWRHPRVDTTRIVIIGHGEGGLAAAMVARRYPNRVTRIALMSTPMLSGKETLLEQLKARELSRGTDAELVGVATGLVAAWCDLLLASPTTDNQALVPSLLSIADSVLMNRPDVAMRYPMVRQLQRPGRELYMQSTLIPWLRSYLWYDRSAYLIVPRPTLALFAERDIEVPGSVHLAAFQYLGKVRSTLGTWTWDLYPNTNHQFQECDDCTEEEMARTGETIRPEVVARLVMWVLQGK